MDLGRPPVDRHARPRLIALSVNLDATVSASFFASPVASTDCTSRITVGERRHRTTCVVGSEILLVFTDPRHVAVRPQQYGGHVQFLADVDDVVDPVRPARHREPARLVEQQSAAAVHQVVEAPPLQPYVPHPPAEQFMPLAEVVAEPDRGGLFDQVAAHVLEVHQFRQQPAHRLGTRFEGYQLGLRTNVVQHVGGHRVPFGVIAVQQPLRCPAVDRGGELPAEVERILDAEVEPLPADRRVDVRRVAGQQHPADPVALGQPGRVTESGEPAR